MCEWIERPRSGTNNNPSKNLKIEAYEQDKIDVKSICWTVRLNDTKEEKRISLPEK